MSLAVKYRPKVWSDVVEQESVVKVLSKQLETRQFKNAYIFSGASGCGKTTNARIFANEINRGLGTPIEIDAASNSGVENMRTIIKSASERALDCEYKIIIVDECFTGDTLIFTADGHKRICDITEEDAVMTPLGFKKVSKVHKIKRKTNLMKIKLNNGNEIKVTENHLILTDNGWIKAKELVKGDKLIDETNVYSMWRDFPNNKYNQNDVFSQENSSRSTTKLGICSEWLGQNRGLSYVLQMRPNLSRDKVGDRGGWQFTQLERGAIERCKERGEDSRIWVEDIEIYESGDEDYSTVYDLSVEGCPMYFANGVLVHNCHSLSTQAWQALLKIIEETPKYTIFIFCTTNPEKIPATIINRCQRFSFTRISTEGIKRRLCQILCNENVGETMKDRDEVTDYIARISKGEMRNAITMLETVIDAGSVDIETCIRVLGSYSYDDYINLTNYLLDGNLTGVSSVINFVYSSGVDMKLFTNTYLSFIMDVLKYCYSRNISNTKIPVNFENEIIKLVDFDNSANYYQYYMDNLLKLKNMIKGDDDPLTTIEIVFNQIGRLI